MAAEGAEATRSADILQDTAPEVLAMADIRRTAGPTVFHREILVIQSHNAPGLRMDGERRTFQVAIKATDDFIGPLVIVAVANLAIVCIVLGSGILSMHGQVIDRVRLIRRNILIAASDQSSEKEQK